VVNGFWPFFAQNFSKFLFHYHTKKIKKFQTGFKILKAQIWQCFRPKNDANKILALCNSICLTKKYFFANIVEKNNFSPLKKP